MSSFENSEISPQRRPQLLAVASKGGHWDELAKLRPAFEAECQVTFACTDPALGEAAGIAGCIGLSDYSQTEPRAVIKGLLETFRLVLRLRPDIVITTGAAPGLLCLLWGRVLGAYTIWIESIANAEELSLSGRLATRFAHKSVTQWEHLAVPGKIDYWGSVL